MANDDELKQLCMELHDARRDLSVERSRLCVTKESLKEAKDQLNNAWEEMDYLRADLSDAQNRLGEARKSHERMTRLYEAELKSVKKERDELKAKLAQSTDQQDAKPKNPYSFRNRTALMATIQDFRKDQSDIRPFLEAFAKCLQHGDI